MINIKDEMKKIGARMREGSPTHRVALRAQLSDAQASREVRTTPRFAWFPLASAGAFAVLVLFVVANNAPRHRYDSTVSFAEESAGMVMYTVPAEDTDEIIDYEDEHGSMLEQRIALQLLTKEEDATTQVRDWMMSLGGHVSSVSDADEYSVVFGTIPADQLERFTEQLAELVPNEAFIQDDVRGNDLIPQAIELDEREVDLQAERARITELLSRATNESERQSLIRQQQSLEAQIKAIEETRQSLKSRVEYVTVSVTLNQLPSVWTADNHYELRRIVAGFEEPNLMQRMGINVLTVVFVALEIVSLTFWLLIPLAIFLFIRARRRRELRALE